MAIRARTTSASILILIVIGSIGLFDLMQRPRFQAFHAVDVLQLLATGMCYGFALAMIIVFLQKRAAE